MVAGRPDGGEAPRWGAQAPDNTNHGTPIAATRISRCLSLCPIPPAVGRSCCDTQSHCTWHHVRVAVACAAAGWWAQWEFGIHLMNLGWTADT